MISLSVVFYMFVLILGVIGGLRGWAKELLVSFSAVLAIFIILVFESYIGIYQEFVAQSEMTRFICRMIIMLVLAFFGYQTPRIRRVGDASRREKFQDGLLGVVVGATNAYLVIGSIWWYLQEIGYENFDFVTAPVAGTQAGDAALRLVAIMPPGYLEIPLIYFAIAVAFTFVVIVYV